MLCFQPIYLMECYYVLIKILLIVLNIALSRALQMYPFSTFFTYWTQHFEQLSISCEHGKPSMFSVCTHTHTFQVTLYSWNYKRLRLYENDKNGEQCPQCTTERFVRYEIAEWHVILKNWQIGADVSRNVLKISFVCNSW